MNNQEQTKFDLLVDRVLSVSKEEILRREADYRARVESRPQRRGPKKGTKRKPKQTSAFPVLVDQLPS